MSKKKCEYCSELFEPKNKVQKYCSSLCRSRTKNKKNRGVDTLHQDRNCLWCGNLISKLERGDKIYCCYECKTKACAKNLNRPSFHGAPKSLAETLIDLINVDLEGSSAIKVEDKEMLIDAKYERALKTLSLHINSKGYVRTSFKTRPVSIHRLIVYLETGELSTKDKPIDHINRNKLDNRTCNLRLTSVSINNRNKDYGNRTEYKGVFKSGNVYYCQAYHNGSNHHIASGFSTALEAALARQRYLNSILI